MRAAKRGARPWGLGIGLGAAAVLLAAAVGCARLGAVLTGGKPEARIAGVRVESFRIDSTTLLFDIEVENRSGHPLGLLDVTTTLSHRGKPFFRERTPFEHVLPRRYEKTLSFPVEIVSARVLRELEGAAPGALLDCQAELALGYEFPAGAAGERRLVAECRLPLAARPELRLAEIEWDVLTAQRAEGRARLRCANANQFPVTLKRLDYTVSLEGTKAGGGALAESLVPAPGAGAFRELPVALNAGDLDAAFSRMLRGQELGYRLGGTLELETPFGPLRLPIAKGGKTPCRR